MSLVDQYINLRSARERQSTKPRRGGKQRVENVDWSAPPSPIIEGGFPIYESSPEEAAREFNPDREWSRVAVGLGRETPDWVPDEWAELGASEDSRAFFESERDAITGAPPSMPTAPNAAQALAFGEPLPELPSLEEARANAVRERLGRVRDARFGQDAGTFGFFEPAIVAVNEGLADQSLRNYPGQNLGNFFEGLNYSLLADPSTGRRDAASRTNYDRVYGAPIDVSGMLDGRGPAERDTPVSDAQRLADRMDPRFLGEDEMTITAASRPERLGEALPRLLTQDSWDMPAERRAGLAEPFLDVADLATDFWRAPGLATEDQAAREAGAMFDYGVSGDPMDLRAAQVAAAEYGGNALLSGLELTPAGLVGDVANLTRGARGAAPEVARRLGDNAPMGFEGAPRARGEPIDVEAAPAPRAPVQRDFQAAVRDPQTGEVYTGLDHMEAIDSAPDGVRERLEAIYNAPSEDPASVGFVVNGQFMGREEGLQAMRAQRPRPVRIGEQVNRDGSVSVADEIDWEAPVDPQRSALRDLGLGAAFGAGGGAGLGLALEGEAEAQDGGDGDGGAPMLPVLGGVAGGLLALRGGMGRNMRSQVGMFAGPNARTANREMLARAEQMAASGASRDDIWRETGWFQGVDGKWRFEIDDSGARLRTNEEVQALGDGMLGRAREIEQGVRARNAALREQPDFFPATVRRANGEARREARGLRERANENYGPTWNEYNGRRMEYDFEHPELYQAYPEVARDVIVARPGVSQVDPGVRGSYNENRITLRRSGDQTSTTLHETQHHLQDVEGFARGGSGSSAYMSGDLRAAWVAETDRLLTPPSYEQFAANETFRGVPEAEVRAQYDNMARDLAAARRDMYNPLSRRAQETAADNIYRRLAGEVEARNTQTRQGMGRSERRSRPPWETQDVPDDQQIIRFDGDRAESRPQRRLGAQSENPDLSANGFEPEAGTGAEQGAIRLTQEQRSALRDLGLGAAIGAGGGAGLGLALEGEAEAQDGGEGGGAPMLPVLGGVAGGLLALRGGLGRNMRSQVGMFAGPNARTANREMLARAEQMAASGASRDDIWRETGWFQGVDGKWRFEIDDSGARVAPDMVERHAGAGVGSSQRRPLNEGLQHDELNAAYDLGDTSLELGRLSRGAVGEYDPKRRIVSMYAANDPEMLRSGTLHETQHHAQRLEGFAQGGSPDNALADELAAINSAMSRNVSEQDHWRSYANNGPQFKAEAEENLTRLRAEYRALIERRSVEISPERMRDAYNRLAGETEARNVQTRRDFTPEERRSRPPWETQDVPDDQQIIRFDGDRAESRPQRRLGAQSENRRLEAAGMDFEVPRGQTGRQAGTGAATDEQIIRLRDQLRQSGESNLQGGVNTIIAERFGMNPNAVAQRIHKIEARRRAGQAGAALGATALGGAALFGEDALAQVQEALADGRMIQGLPEGVDLRDGQWDEPAWLPIQLADGSEGIMRSITAPDGTVYNIIGRQNQDTSIDVLGYVNPAPLPRLGTEIPQPPARDPVALSDANVRPSEPYVRRLGAGFEFNEDSQAVEFPLWARTGAAIVGGLGARRVARQFGARGAPLEAATMLGAGGGDMALGGSPEEAALAAVLVPSVNYGVREGIVRPMGEMVENYRLPRDEQFVARRDRLAGTLSEDAPQARGMVIEQDPFDHYAYGEAPGQRGLIPMDEMLDQGWMRDLPGTEPSPREAFLDLPPIEQQRYMQQQELLDQRLARTPVGGPDTGQIGFARGREAPSLRALPPPDAGASGAGNRAAPFEFSPNDFAERMAFPRDVSEGQATVHATSMAPTYMQPGNTRFGNSGTKFVTVNGEPVARAEITQAADGGPVTVQIIETVPGAQRSGYARQLIDDLYAEFGPFRTTAQSRDGAGLFANYERRADGTYIPRNAPDVDNSTPNAPARGGDGAALDALGPVSPDDVGPMPRGYRATPEDIMENPDRGTLAQQSRLVNMMAKLAEEFGVEVPRGARGGINRKALSAAMARAVAAGNRALGAEMRRRGLWSAALISGAAGAETVNTDPAAFDGL